MYTSKNVVLFIKYKLNGIEYIRYLKCKIVRKDGTNVSTPIQD